MPTIIEEYRRAWREFATELKNIGAVTMTSSGLSFNLNTVNDIEPGPLETYHVEMAAHLMRHVICMRGSVFDAYVGVPKKGDLFAGTVKRIADERTPEDAPKTPLITLGKWEHGGQKRIMSSFTSKVPITANRILLIDDYIATGNSAMQTIENLQAAEMTVADVVVLVDCGQGGRELLDEWNYRLHSVFTAAEFPQLLAA